MSDTPRTDEIVAEAPNVWTGQTERAIDLARALERELAEADANAPWMTAAHLLFGGEPDLYDKWKADAMGNFVPCKPAPQPEAKT